MLDIDRVWARCSQLPLFAGKRFGDFGLQVVPVAFTLTTQQQSGGTPVNFPNGAIVVNIAAGARPSAAAAAQSYTYGLDLFSVAIQIQQGRYIVGPTAAMASSVFGQGVESVFPEKELILPTNSQLLYSVTNLTTTTIDVTIAAHCLVPLAVG